MSKGIKDPTLVNAQEMGRQHPKTFGVPTQAELDGIKVGSLVKVSCDRERFWAEVMTVGENKDGTKVFIGRVDNDLIYTSRHGLQCDDLFHLVTDNVYSTTPPL